MAVFPNWRVCVLAVGHRLLLKMFVRDKEVFVLVRGQEIIGDNIWYKLGEIYVI